MLDYLPSLVAFAAAIVALSGGKKTDPAKRGLGRLTLTGWIAIVLAVLALGASAAITRRSHDALAAQARQQQALRSIAHAELRLSMNTITQWFFLLLGDDGPDARYQLVPPHVFDKERIYAAQSIDIREPLTVFSPPTTWANLLQSSADRGSRQVTETLQIYAPYLEPEVLALVSELRTSDFLVLRLRRLDEHVNDNKDVEKLTFYFIDPPGMLDHMDTGYERFWNLVSRLDKLLERDTSRLERRLAP